MSGPIRLAYRTLRCCDLEWLYLRPIADVFPIARGDCGNKHNTEQTQAAAAAAMWGTGCMTGCVLTGSQEAGSQEISRDLRKRDLRSPRDLRGAQVGGISGDLRGAPLPLEERRVQIWQGTYITKWAAGASNTPAVQVGIGILLYFSREISFRTEDPTHTPFPPFLGSFASVSNQVVPCCSHHVLSHS